MKLPKNLRKKKKKEIKKNFDIPFKEENLFIYEIIGDKCAQLARFLGIDGETIFAVCMWDGLTRYYSEITNIDQALQEKEITEKERTKQIIALHYDVKMRYNAIFDTLATLPHFMEIVDEKAKSSIKEWRKAYSNFIKNTEPKTKE